MAVANTTTTTEMQVSIDVVESPSRVSLSPPAVRNQEEPTVEEVGGCVRGRVDECVL